MYTAEMLGVCIGEGGAAECINFPDPEALQPGHAKLKVIWAGICATDLQLLAGYKGASSAKRMILGHEFVATVDAIHYSERSGELFKIGDRVVSEINCIGPETHSCGDWRERAQDPRRTALGIFGSDGCFAEFVVVPVKNLHHVPAEIPSTDAVFLEPLAAACSILDEVKIRITDRCAVLGAGRLGSLIAAVLSASQFDVHVLVRDPARASHVAQVAPGRDVPVVDVNSVESNSFDVVVDATGNPLGLQRALELCKPRGTIVLKSTYAPGSSDQVAIDMSLIVVKELHVVGSRCGPFAAALRLLEKDLVRPEALIKDSYELGDATEAFADAKRPGSLKVLFEIGVFADPEASLRRRESRVNNVSDHE